MRVPQLKLKLYLEDKGLPNQFMALFRSNSNKTQITIPLIVFGLLINTC